LTTQGERRQKSFAPDFVFPASLPVQPEKKGTIMRSIFKLKDRGRAILSEDDYRNVIVIPPSAMVVLVGGNIDEDTFVKIRYEGRVLLMLAEDLRSGGELWGQSA
jgi:hypothetical protein